MCPAIYHHSLLYLAVIYVHSNLRTPAVLRQRSFSLKLRHVLQNNAGQQSGAIYAHGLQDGDLSNDDQSTVGCSVRVYNSTLEGNMGTQAGAVHMS